MSVNTELILITPQRFLAISDDILDHDLRYTCQYFKHENRQPTSG